MASFSSVLITSKASNSKVHETEQKYWVPKCIDSYISTGIQGIRFNMTENVKHKQELQQLKEEKMIMQ